jgi:hypothetical protein
VRQQQAKSRGVVHAPLHRTAYLRHVGCRRARAHAREAQRDRHGSRQAGIHFVSFLSRKALPRIAVFNPAHQDTYFHIVCVWLCLSLSVCLCLSLFLSIFLSLSLSHTHTLSLSLSLSLSLLRSLSLSECVCVCM